MNSSAPSEGDSSHDKARRYVEALTGLRGIAAVFVFLFHYQYFNPGVSLREAVPFIGGVLQYPFDFGFMGVDLFFVLSGFLLTLPFAAAAVGEVPRPNIGRYFRRRVLRVFPAYYAQLAIILLVGSWFVTWKDLPTGSLLAHAVMFLNVGPEPVRPMVGVWWTLPVEFGFYLLLPLIAWAFRPGRWPLLLAATAASIAYRWWTAGHFEPGNPMMLAANHLPGSLPEFLLGAGAAILTQRAALRGSKPRKPVALDLTVLAAAVGVGAWSFQVVGRVGGQYWQGHWSMIIAPVVLGLFLAVMVWAVYNGSRLGRLLFSNRVVHFLGLISYSLYLWHFVVMQQLIQALGDSYAQISPLPRFLVSAAAVILVSWLSYWLVERPFFRQHRFKAESGQSRGTTP